MTEDELDAILDTAFLQAVGKIPERKHGYRRKNVEAEEKARIKYLRHRGFNIKETAFVIGRARSTVARHSKGLGTWQ